MWLTFLSDFLKCSILPWEQPAWELSGDFLKINYSDDSSIYDVQPETPVEINLPEFKELPRGDSADSPDYWFLSEDEKAEFAEMGGIDRTEILEWFIDPKHDFLAVAVKLSKELGNRGVTRRDIIAIFVFKVSLPISVY